MQHYQHLVLPIAASSSTADCYQPLAALRLWLALLLVLLVPLTTAALLVLFQAALLVDASCSSGCCCCCWCHRCLACLHHLKVASLQPGTSTVLMMVVVRGRYSVWMPL